MEVFRVLMMNYLNKKYYIWLLIGFSVLVYLIILQLFPITNKTLFNYLKHIPTVVTFDIIFACVFSKCFWKWKLLYNRIVPFPNLNGTWKGFLKSTWIDPKTRKRPTPIPVILTIKQSFLSISCVMRTREMESYSFICGFVINQDNQILRLVYLYDSIPKQTVKDRSPNHYGTMILNITNSYKRELIGEYWTGRKTTGTVKLEFWKKEHLDKYPEDLGEHPVSKIRNDE